MKNRGRSFVTIIFIVTTIAAGAAALYFGVEYSKVKNENQLENKIESTESKADEKTENKVTEKIVEKYAKPVSLDSSKCINKSGEYKINISNNSSYVSCYVKDEDSTKASITVYWNTVAAALGINSNSIKGNISTFEISCSGKIIDIVGTTFKNTGDYFTVMFLLDDGSIEYIPLKKALNENNVISYGKIPEVSNVSYIIPDVSYDNGHVVVGLKDDGSFYNLSELLLETGNYNF